MKRTIISLVFISLLIASSSAVYGQRGNFSGSWKLDRTKSVVGTEWPVLIKIRIEFKGDTLLTERVYDTGDGQEYPFSEKLNLDNKEYSMIIYEMPRKIKGALSEQDAVLNFESTTTFNGSAGNEDFISKETWKVDTASGILTIGFVNKTSAGEAPGSLVYIKE
jgi:hypothetical protein